MIFTSDELILALMSLARVTHPSMLRQEPDGFTVDFEAIERSPFKNDAEQILLKIRPLLANAGPEPRVLDLTPPESQRLHDTLASLETSQVCPADVLAMSQALRQRLTGSP
jgi:hypothetical protein